MTTAGHLFLGHTESLNGLDVPFEHLGHSVYAVTHNRPPFLAAAPVKHIGVKPQHLKKVLCVDDSPTSLALLKEIFTPDCGFEVAATAHTGIEAIEKLKVSHFDLITLDIQMPEMDGFEFLKKSDPFKRPPIMVISSVDRLDQTLAQEMLSSGVRDYVEKPSIKEFSKCREEIVLKAKLLVCLNQVVDYQKTADALIKSSSVKIVDSKKKVAALYYTADSPFGKIHNFQKNSVFPVQSIGLVPHQLQMEQLKEFSAIVVFSQFNHPDLFQLKVSGKSVFLLEEAFQQSDNLPQLGFELFSLTSLAYAVDRHLKEKGHEQKN